MTETLSTRRATPRLAIDVAVEVHAALDRVLAAGRERLDVRPVSRPGRYVPRDGTLVDERIFRASPSLQSGAGHGHRHTGTRSPR